MMHPTSSMYRVLLLGAVCLCYGVLGSGEKLTDYRRPIEVKVRCCREVSPAKINFNIIGYKIQKEAKPCIYAVIFRTEKDGSYCCDPKARWVQKKVAELSKGTEKLPTGGRKGKKKPNSKKKEKRKGKAKSKKAPVTPLWFPAYTAAVTALK